MFGVVLAVLTIAALVTLPSKWRQKCGMERQRDEQRIKISELKRQIAQYKEKQHRFKTDPAFVEHVARETRRVQPGELVFVFDSAKQ